MSERIAAGRPVPAAAGQRRIVSVPVARFVAVAVAVPTFMVLLAGGGVRADNPFLVPDLILSAVLVVAAVLPAPAAVPVMLVGFGYATGVITTAVFSHVARGAFSAGIPALVAALACVVMTVLLALDATRGRSDA